MDGAERLTHQPQTICGLSEIQDRYDLIFCDLWGCVHDGAQAFPAAVEAMVKFRKKGGKLVFVSNTPKAAFQLGNYLSRLGIPDTAHDAMVTAGDIMRDAVSERGGMIDFVGNEGDFATIDGLCEIAADLDHAAYNVCTPLFSSLDELKALDPHLARLKERDLLMVCGNPDLVVEDHGMMLYCPGSLAERYEAIGGKVLRTGKPEKAIYDKAMALTEFEGPKDRILAIGDGLRTDIQGANNLGIDSWFLTDGIHREEIEENGTEATASEIGVTPNHVSTRFVW